MKKIRLYTRNEELRFVGVIFFVIFIAANVLLFYVRGFDEIALKIAISSMGILLIFETIIFPFWYIPERKKQKAIKYGEVYIGKYCDITTRKQFVISPHHRRTSYEVQIEVEVNGKNEIVCTDSYYDDPRYYIVKNQECKVYRYKGKFYPEIIYYDPKVKKEIIFEHYEHEEELIIPYVKYLRDGMDITVLMTVKAIVNKPVYAYKMNLEKEVCEFMDTIPRERRRNRNDEELISGIENIVRNELNKIDSIIQIKSIYVRM